MYFKQTFCHEWLFYCAFYYLLVSLGFIQVRTHLNRQEARRPFGRLPGQNNKNNQDSWAAIWSKMMCREWEKVWQRWQICLHCGANLGVQSRCCGFGSQVTRWEAKIRGCVSEHLVKMAICYWCTATFSWYFKPVETIIINLTLNRRNKYVLITTKQIKVHVW